MSRSTIYSHLSHLSLGPTGELVLGLSTWIYIAVSISLFGTHYTLIQLASTNNAVHYASEEVREWLHVPTISGPNYSNARLLWGSGYSDTVVHLVLTSLLVKPSSSPTNAALCGIHYLLYDFRLMHPIICLFTFYVYKVKFTVFTKRKCLSYGFMFNITGEGKLMYDSHDELGWLDR